MQLKEKIIFEPDGFSQRKLKTDFVDYCVDLQKIESGFLHWEKKMGFSYQELFEMALHYYPNLKEKIEAAAVICVAHAEYDYDPDYSHIVSYLVSSMRLNAVSFSIHVDRKVLVKTAKHLLNEILLPNNIGLLIDFEQSVLPLKSNNVTDVPRSSAVGFYFYHKPDAPIVPDDASF